MGDNENIINRPSVIINTNDYIITQNVNSDVIEEMDIDKFEIINEEEIQRELTQNFLSGKLSFTEYAEQMETNDVEEHLDEPSTSQTAKVETTKKKEVRKTRIRRTLPITLKGLIGEANIRFARGDHITAEKMCLEVIREVPTAPEPYFTLAQLYEKINPEKSLQFDLIAAHLSPNDEERWIRLGKMSEQLNNMKQADTCYAKAVCANPNNIALHIKRINFLESMGDVKSVMKAKFRALNYMTIEHIELMINITRELVKQYFDLGEINKAKDSIAIIFKKFPKYVTPELVNIMLELLLHLKNYKGCLEILVQHCDIDIEFETEMFMTIAGEIEEKINIISYHLPSIIQIDLHIKFIICLIYLKAFPLLESLLTPLLTVEEDVEKNGDLYLDLAEALMDVGLYNDALKLTVPLVKSKNFGMPAVWLRHADCQKAAKLYNDAVESYKKVMYLQPDHVEVRYPLSELLIKLNRKREALQILEQDETCEEIEVKLLFQRCKLLRELKMFNKYWQASSLLLSRHCSQVRNRDEMFKITNMQQIDKKGGALKLLRTERGEDPLDSGAVFNESNEIPVEEEFEFFKELLGTCLKKNRYDLMQRFTFSALCSKRFKEFKNDVELMAIFACIYNEDCFHGYNLVRDLVVRNLRNRKCWNLYNIMIQRSDDSRHNRFLMRLLARVDVDMHLHILHANNCLIAGTYKYALSEYIALYRIREEPLLAFLIGVTLFQMASQKFSAKKNHLVIQGIGFFNIYKRLRGPDGIHEVYYNIGRGYHQLGLLHIAESYYKKVLTTTSVIASKYPHLFDLKREAAFNLHLIYKNSGAYDLATMYLMKYIVI